MATSFSIVTKYTVSGLASGPVAVSVTETADGLAERLVQVGASATQEVDIAFAFASLKWCFITSDKAVTLKTNDSSSPDDTLALGAGKVIAYSSTNVDANPFTADVTKIFVINGPGAVANVQIAILADSTP